MQQPEDDRKRRVSVVVPGDLSDQVIIIPDSYEPEKFRRKTKSVKTEPVIEKQVKRMSKLASKAEI